MTKLMTDLPANDKVRIVDEHDRQKMTSSTLTSSLRWPTIHLIIIYSLLGLYGIWFALSYQFVRKQLVDEFQATFLSAARPEYSTTTKTWPTTSTIHTENGHDSSFSASETLLRYRRSADNRRPGRPASSERYSRRHGDSRRNRRQRKRKNRQGRYRNRETTNGDLHEVAANRPTQAAFQSQIGRVIHMHVNSHVDRLYQSPSLVSFNASGDTSYRFWKEADWVTQDTEEIFKLKHDSGHVAVKQAGVYMIYAQMVYHDLTGRWSFGVYIDGVELVKCLSSEQLRNVDSLRPTSHGVYHQCNTVITVFINTLQSVNIRCMYGSRTILTQPEFTFWGIVKLS